MGLERLTPPSAQGAPAPAGHRSLILPRSHCQRRKRAIGDLATGWIGATRSCPDRKPHPAAELDSSGWIRTTDLTIMSRVTAPNGGARRSSWGKNLLEIAQGDGGRVCRGSPGMCAIVDAWWTSAATSDYWDWRPRAGRCASRAERKFGQVRRSRCGHSTACWISFFARCASAMRASSAASLRSARSPHPRRPWLLAARMPRDLFKREASVLVEANQRDAVRA